MKLGILILTLLLVFAAIVATSNTETTNETKPETTATPKPRLSDILNAGN